ncbi:MAG: aldo/keto reductase [Gemmatimonadota bacterium]|nr:aldo/keto reductase [Gemmatimonadota bacterium]
MESPGTSHAQSESPRLSPLGIGSALGAPSDDEDSAYATALRRALELGLNHIDTAINFRCQRSERLIGKVLRDGAANGAKVFVTTKGGYLPLESPPPQSKAEYRAYIEREYLDSGIVEATALVAGGHCISPRFLRDQVERSSANLGVGAIDIYYIHNPEQQLDAVAREEFDARMRDAFAELESCVDDGLISSYGCATWDGLRVPKSAQNHLSIETLVRIAHDIAGDDHHMMAFQMPISLGMMEGVRVATQLVNSRERTSLEAADELGVAMIAVAPLMQGRLVLDLPAAARDAFPEAETDAACALSFVRMVPHVASIVVGMRSVKHVEENVALFA